MSLTDPEGLAKSNPGARSGGGRYDSPFYRRGGVENKGTLPPIDPVAFRMRKLHQQFQNEGIPEGACDYNPALCIVPEEDPFEACELECQDKDHGVCPAPPPAPRFGQVLLQQILIVMWFVNLKWKSLNGLVFKIRDYFLEVDGGDVKIT